MALCYLFADAWKTLVYHILDATLRLTLATWESETNSLSANFLKSSCQNYRSFLRLTPGGHFSVMFCARKTKYFNEIHRNDSKQSQYYVKCTENEKNMKKKILTFFDLRYII